MGVAKEGSVVHTMESFFTVGLTKRMTLGQILKIYLQAEDLLWLKLSHTFLVR